MPPSPSGRPAHRARCPRPGGTARPSATPRVGPGPSPGFQRTSRRGGRSFSGRAPGHVGAMSDRWYETAVIYCADVDTFAASNGDGVGDFNGLIGRLDYLARLGITCLWLTPIHPTPNRD